MGAVVAEHVFISYCRADGEYTRRLISHLRSARINIWSDRQIEYGAAWEQTVCQQIDTCAAMVVIMSPQAEASTWVANEIARAQRRRKPIMPLLLAGEVMFRLGRLQYVDVTNGTMPGRRFVSDLRLLAKSAHDCQAARETA
jgi:hypothetical protein